MSIAYGQVSGHREKPLLTVNLAEAKGNLSALLDRVEKGEDVMITRHGRVAARISPAPRPKRPLPLDALAAFRAGMPRLRRSSAKLLCEARDEGR